MEKHFFKDVTDLLLNGMGSNLFHQSGNIIAGVAPVFQIGFGIYILLVAFNYYNKGVDTSIVDLSKNAVGWLIVIACAFNAGQYARIANFAWGLPEALSGLLSTTHFSASALDDIFTNFMKTIVEISKQSEALPIRRMADKLAISISITVMTICFGVLFAIIT